MQYRWTQVEKGRGKGKFVIQNERKQVRMRVTPACVWQMHKLYRIQRAKSASSICWTASNHPTIGVPFWEWELNFTSWTSAARPNQAWGLILLSSRATGAVTRPQCCMGWIGAGRLGYWLLAAPKSKGMLRLGRRPTERTLSKSGLGQHDSRLGRPIQPGSWYQNDRIWSQGWVSCCYS